MRIRLFRMFCKQRRMENDVVSSGKNADDKNV